MSVDTYRRFIWKGSATMGTRLRPPSPEELVALRLARSLVVAILALTILLVAGQTALAHLS